MESCINLHVSLWSIYGLAPCPRKFTKITKIPMSKFRLEGCPIEGYIDDFITLAQEENRCASNVEKIVTMLDNLGFVVHPVKSHFKPTKF